MKKILFITVWFYPVNRVSVLRTGTWVKYLARNGFEVIVLTPKKYSFMGSLDLEVELPKNVKVIEVDFLPKFLGKKLQSKKGRSSLQLRSSSRLILILVKMKGFFRKYLGSLFDEFDLWTKPAFRKAKEIIKKESIEYIISSYGPAAPAVVAHKLKSRYPYIEWISDFRDLWAYNHISHGKGIWGRYEKYKERRTLSNVDKIITVSTPLSEIIRKIYPDKKIYTIENGFDPEEFIGWEERIKAIQTVKINDRLVISYLGIIYPGKQDPSILFKACNELIEEGFIDKSQIEINFYSRNKRDLENTIKPKDHDRYGIIHINGFVPRKEALRIQRKSDLLLFLEWNDPSAKGVLTGKLFEYLVSGTPILAVGISNKNAAGEVIERTGTGKLFLDKDTLKQELKTIFQSKQITFYKPRIGEIRKYSRDKQVKRLIDIMGN